MEVKAGATAEECGNCDSTMLESVQNVTRRVESDDTVVVDKYSLDESAEEAAMGRFLVEEIETWRIFSVKAPITGTSTNEDIGTASEGISPFLLVPTDFRALCSDQDPDRIQSFSEECMILHETYKQAKPPTSPDLSKVAAQLLMSIIASTQGELQGDPWLMGLRSKFRGLKPSKELSICGDCLRRAMGRDLIAKFFNDLKERHNFDSKKAAMLEAKEREERRRIERSKTIKGSGSKPLDEQWLNSWDGTCMGYGNCGRLLLSKLCFVFLECEHYVCFYCVDTSLELQADSLEEKALIEKRFECPAVGCVKKNHLPFLITHTLSKDQIFSSFVPAGRSPIVLDRLFSMIKRRLEYLYDASPAPERLSHANIRISEENYAALNRGGLAERGLLQKEGAKASRAFLYRRVRLVNGSVEKTSLKVATDYRGPQGPVPEPRKCENAGISSSDAEAESEKKLAIDMEKDLHNSIIQQKMEEINNVRKFKDIDHLESIVEAGKKECVDLRRQLAEMISSSSDAQSEQGQDQQTSCLNLRLKRAEHALRRNEAALLEGSCYVEEFSAEVEENYLKPSRERMERAIMKIISGE
ncbi:hypothetical protein BJ508DRAFT_339906 [Ascobolus immersus RN42]|uniref:Uncharacterized protein n=1 Tax=Ascobolus immersus RN42 TaxID=1160509 RepID=A0A3N4IGI5_ASCIM|nr:hypothetical protein BJ508DRAFT_339906 [Ascobolus immersus RN42]